MLVYFYVLFSMTLEAQTFRAGRFYAPYKTYRIGVEYTLTNSELMLDPASDAIVDSCYAGNGDMKYDFEFVPIHLKYFERIFKELFDEPFTAEVLTRNSCNKVMLHISLKQFRGAPSWVKYMVDPHIIEVIFPPAFFEKSLVNGYFYDFFVFEIGRMVGLRPDRNWGQAHVNIDALKAVRTDPLVYRNFVVGQLQSWPFWSLIGVDIQSSVWDWTNQRKALEAVQKFFFEVLDPWILKWANDPRWLTNKEMISIACYFDKKSRALFKNKWIMRREVNSYIPMKQKMGFDIIRAAHMALESWRMQYNAKLKSSFHLGFRIRRGRPVFEFRRVPALYDMTEDTDWTSFIISQFEDVIHLNGFLNFEPMPPLTYSEQMKYFNTRLLSLGFNPEVFRPFLNPRFRSLRYFVDPCSEYLSVLPSIR